MKPLIGLIPPNRKIGVRALEVAADLGIKDQIILRHGVDEIALDHGREFESLGVDVIISRGIASDSVKSIVKTPVLNIPVTGQDLVTVLHEAKKSTKLQRPKIALMAFSSLHRDIESLAELLGIDLLPYPIINNLEFIREQIRKAKNDGAHVVVAGHISSLLAEELGMPAIMLDSGTVALRTVLQEAQTVAYARKLEQARSRRLQAIIDKSQSGMFVVDAGGNIQAANTMARQILNAKIELERSKASDVLPTQLVTRSLDFSEPIVDEMVEINGSTVFLNTDIVKIGTKIIDVIFTLQPATVISELESKIRKSLHSRGLTCDYSFSDIWGGSDQLKSTISWAKSFAATDSPILLVGETGTGKELFAQAIHQVSPYGLGPFVAINCASLPPSLLESELFGHEEGAFTGARRSGKQGLFELANNGTIFLDEISEMDHYGQTRLLRVLQERCTMRIGGDKYIPVNARVIAASNQNLPELVEKGEFRKDLFFRLNILPLHIPPLRERVGDVACLTKRFIEIYQGKYASSLELTDAAIRILEDYSWPGNIRELSGVIERLALMARNAPITEEFLKSQLFSHSLPTGTTPPSPEKITWPPSERDNLIDALKKNGWHQAKTAKELGMHRTTLQRKMKALKIKRC